LERETDPSSRHPWRGVMTACSFKKLLQLLDNQLNLDEKLEVLDHLDSCRICRDAVYQISRDRDEAFFIYRPYNVEKHIA
jgi:anti-sigma factor RsiW